MWRYILEHKKVKPMDSIMAYVNNIGKGIHLKMRTLLLACLCFATTISVSTATTLVAVRDDKGIFIAADGKWIGEEANRCKIGQSGDIFFGLASTPLIKEETFYILRPPTEREVFNAYKIIDDAARVPSRITRKIDIIETRLVTALTSILEYIRGKYPSKFQSIFLKDDKVVLSVVIAGIDHSTPMLYGREFKLTSDCCTPVTLHVERRNYTHQPVSNITDIILFGEHKSIRPQRNNFIDSDQTISSLNQWFDKEIANHPDKVGRPVDILRITPNKTEWIQHKPECPEIDKKDFRHSS
jgi:hypothetical protein